LWLGASEVLDICDFERGPFLNLYRIAHNKSTVDKWDNFPGEIPRRNSQEKFPGEIPRRNSQGNSQEKFPGEISN
jgi:hypothetical protein